MKRLYVICFMALALAGCTNIADNETVVLFNANESGIKVFKASTEQCGDITKVYADENLKVLWNAGDYISIFNKTTYNYQYKFNGEDGATAGDFINETPSGFHTAGDLEHIYAVYPYSSANQSSNEGVITMTLPAEQSYKENSFGIGANTMIAISDGDFLPFKNIGGYREIRLYGDDVKVSGVSIKGNNGEKIAGKAEVSIPFGGLPTVTMDDTATDDITIFCDSPVKLGTSKDDYTSFWFVIPPTVFENGITITVTDENGSTFTKSTSKTIQVTRNQIDWMSALKVTPVSASKYLTFTSEGTTTISLSNYNDNAPLLYYSYDKIKWTPWDYSELTFTNSTPLYFCGDNPDGISHGGNYSSNQYSQFVSTGANYSVSGDIMSLINKNEDVLSITSEYCFYRLFGNCSGLITPPELPATTLAAHCYDELFWKCTNLSSAPELPATTLAGECYRAMFMLSGLTTAPVLPATIMQPYCYNLMFLGCSNLSSAPTLPSESLATACYYCMFQDCTSLTSAPELPSITLADQCYYGMFSGCESLNYVKCLATDISAERCIDRWLHGVADTGTFIKAASKNDWPTGTSGIPEGWAVIDAE